MKTAKELIQQKIECEKFDIELLAGVTAAVKSLEGKRWYAPTKLALINELQKIGAEKVSIRQSYGWAELEFIIPNSPEPERRKEIPYRFMLWYDREATGKVRSDLIAERNTWASKGAPERLEKLKGELRSPAKQQLLDVAATLTLPSLADTLETASSMEVFYQWRQENAAHIETIVRKLGGRMN